MKRKDVSLWVLALLLAMSLAQALTSGRHGPVTLIGIVSAAVGLVIVGWGLLRERKRSKSQSDVGRQMRQP
jgi:hypothetical protein